MNNNKINHYEIALAGYLHDIGKFSQRSFDSSGGSKQSSGLSEQSKNMKQYICPSYNGNYSHYHVLYTNEFIESLNNIPESINKSIVANLASYHHSSDSSEQKIIALADRISAAGDRDGIDETTNKNTFRRKRLQSIATLIKDNEEDNKFNLGYKIAKLSQRRNILFPLLDTLSDIKLTTEYKTLWDEFNNIWSNNKCRKPIDYINRVDNILEMYTGNIPSATNTDPSDISLYDHAKTTAAIATALFLSNEKEKPFILYSCDMSGIQKYIYNIKKGSGSLAKRLRAKSFQVAIYNDIISQIMLHRMDLPICQRLIMAGGKFTLLLPNNTKYIEIIQDCLDEAEEWLLERTGGESYLTTAQFKCSEEDFKDFSSTSSRLNDLLVISKQQAYRNKLTDNKKSWKETCFLGESISLEDDENICKSCGLAIAEEDGLCDDCLADRDIGVEIIRSRVSVLWILSRVTLTSIARW